MLSDYKMVKLRTKVLLDIGFVLIAISYGNIRVYSVATKLITSNKRY